MADEEVAPKKKYNVKISVLPVAELTVFAKDADEAASIAGTFGGEFTSECWLAWSANAGDLKKAITAVVEVEEEV